MFAGAFAGVDPTFVELSNDSKTDYVLDPLNASVTGQFNSDGTYKEDGVTSQTWLLIGSAADYELRVTLSSGTLDSGTTGSWLALSSSRSYTVNQTVVGTKQAVLLCEIRMASTGIVLATATMTLTATVDI